MSTKRLNVTTILVVVALSAGFLFGLMLPGERRLSALQASIAQEQAQVARQQAEVGNVSEVYLQLQALAGRLKTFRRQLPSDRRVGEFLNDLSDTMTRTGITEFQVQQLPATRVMSNDLPENMKQVNGTGVQPVRISFRSDFRKAFELLGAIEKLARLAYVEQFEVKVEDEFSGVVSVTMVVQAFHHDHGQLLNGFPADLSSMNVDSEKNNG